MRSSTMSYLLLGAALLLLVLPCSSFVPNINVRHHNLHTLRSTPDTNTNDDAVASAVRLKEELLALADSTQRGFKANRSEKQQVKQIVNKLAKLNPTAEPAKYSRVTPRVLPALFTSRSAVSISFSGASAIIAKSFCRKINLMYAGVQRL